MTDNPTCATCRWWRPDAQQCRRHAPVVVPTNEGCRYHTEWPGVSSYDFCGEHAPRVEAPTSRNEGPTLAEVRRVDAMAKSIGEMIEKGSTDAR